MLRRVPPVTLLVLLLPVASAGAPMASPSDPRNFTWVEEGVLAVGGGGLTKGQVDWLHAQGFRAIADFRAEHQDPEAHVRAMGMEFLDLPVDHAVHMDVGMLQRFVAWAREQEAAGRPVYVHCTNGWHRAAAFAAAWEMARHNLSFDEAGERGVERRPGTVMRAPGPLLAYEAILRGEPGLQVMLLSGRARPEPNGTMEVTVEALAGAQPAAGARVKVWSEESRLRLEGVAGPDGRFTFTYRAPPEGVFMDHLYARASLPGFVDGADNVELFFQQPVNPGPIEVDAAWTPEGLRVEVRKHGHPVRAHLVATAGAWSAHAIAGGGTALLPLPDPAQPVVLRAERWGADGARVELPPPDWAVRDAKRETPLDDVRPPARTAPPRIDAPPRVAPAPDAAPPEPGREHPHRLALAYATGGLLLSISLVLMARHRRAHRG